MVASEFLDYLSKLQVSTNVGLEDLPDRLNFTFSVIVLMVCILIVTVKQYVFKPISCYLPNNIGGSNLLSYVENLCWVQGTIALSNQAKFPSTDEEWKNLEKHKMLYYQWVPFMLGLQCIMFYVPKLVWQIICYNRTGTDIQHLVVSANQAVHSSDEARSKMVSYLSKTLEQLLYQHRDHRSGKLAKFRRKIHNSVGFLMCSKRIGTWLVSSYLLLKLSYVANGFIQLIIMQKFLGFSDFNLLTFGIEVGNNIWSGTDWKTTLIFPRVSYCFVKVTHLGVINSMVAQCVLPVNMLNERIYFFLWCWILIVLSLTILSIPIWILRILCIKYRRHFIRQFLIISEEITKDQKENYLLAKFESQFLRHDGIFLLKMISLNAGDIITSEIVCQLWNIYKTNYVNRNFLNDGSDEDDDKSRTMIKLGFLNNKLADKTSPSAPSGLLNS